jgi:succinate dehydrogenase / fumarate reductase flavoprotein subunit
MDQEIKEGRGCGPNKDYILLKLDHLGADTIHKRLPSVYEIGVNFANVDITKDPSPWCPPSTTRWVACPPTSTARSWSLATAQNNSRGQRPVRRGRMRLRERARRQPPGHQLAAGPAGVRQGRWPPHREFNNKNKEHKPLPADAADRTLERLNQLESSKSGIYAQTWLATSAPRCSSTLACSAPRPAWTKASRRSPSCAIAWQASRCKDKSKVFNTARIEALEVDNLIEVAQATMVSAAARKECRGAHTVYDYEHPADHPEFPLGRNDKEWMKHTLWYSEGNRLTYKPVNLKPLTVDSVPPKVRTF